MTNHSGRYPGVLGALVVKDPEAESSVILSVLLCELRGSNLCLLTSDFASNG